MTENNIVIVNNSYEASKHNATKHGILSKYTVMQWENSADYDALHDSLIDEHKPEGATETHLVEELVGIIWRKMRLRYAEMTSTQEVLHRHINAGDSVARAALLDSSMAIKDFDLKKAVTCTEKETQATLKEVKQYLGLWKKGRALLESTNSYENALAALHEDDQRDWRNEYLGQRISDYSARVHQETADSLMYWICDNIPYYEKKIYELESRDKIKAQVLGQAFLSMDSINKYTRYENHLDRKFEKTLSILFKLQEMRGKDFSKNTGQ